MRRYLIIFTIIFLLLPVSGVCGQDACDEALELGKQGMSIHDPSDRQALRKAMALYREALDTCPEICRDYPQICANLAHALYVSGDPEKAIVMYKQAARFNPDYGTPFYGLGEIYLDKGLLGFALDNFMRAYLLDRRDVEARAMAAKVFGMICERNKTAGGINAEDVGRMGLDRRNFEDKLLMDKNFSEVNRRFFYCEQKTIRVEFVLRNVTFETGKAILKKEAYPQIETVSKILNDNEQLKVILEGHTDNVPMRRGVVSPGVTCSDNMCLSKARAESVKTALVEKYHVGPQRIKAMAFGDTRPLDPANTKEARAKNRRVTLVLDRGED